MQKWLTEVEHPQYLEVAQTLKRGKDFSEQKEESVQVLGRYPKYACNTVSKGRRLIHNVLRYR